MELEKREDGWWIINAPTYTHKDRDGAVERYNDYGPYPTKADANHVKRGLEKTLKEVS